MKARNKLLHSCMDAYTFIDEYLFKLYLSSCSSLDLKVVRAGLYTYLYYWGLDLQERVHLK